MTHNYRVILHLSDIHFVKGMAGTTYDLDEELRDELERDAQTMFSKLSRVDAIIVTGDIAFSAKPTEYDFAENWLKQLADKFACPYERIWTIPGNHDVDWEVLKNNPTLKLMHDRLRSVNIRNLNKELTEFIRDDRLGDELLRPLHTYMAFAKKFDCHFEKTLFWEKEIKLHDNSILKVRGLTSPLVSNSDDGVGRMILGLWPAMFKRLKGVEYIILSHHPIDWFREQEEIEKRLVSRGRILLFGHKHDQKLHRVEDSVMLTAGAVHPYRGEAGWQPRYNWIVVSVRGKTADRHLTVEVHPRLWNDTSRRFEPDIYKEQDHRKYEFEIEPWDTTELAGKDEKQQFQTTKSDQEVILNIALEVVNAPPLGTTPEAKAMDDALTIADKFWRLPYHIRVKILREIDLIKETDKSLPEEERVIHAFRRAKEGNRLERLIQEVNKHYSQRSGVPNTEDHSVEGG